MTDQFTGPPSDKPADSPFQVPAPTADPSSSAPAPPPPPPSSLTPVAPIRRPKSQPVPEPQPGGSPTESGPADPSPASVAPVPPSQQSRPAADAPAAPIADSQEPRTAADAPAAPVAPIADSQQPRTAAPAPPAPTAPIASPAPPAAMPGGLSGTAPAVSLDPVAFSQRFDALVRNVAAVIQGKDDVVRLATMCLLAEGHILLEDVPGVGKTSLARALAASVRMSWNRIQFTPDLLPSDVTGVSIFNQRTNDFEFRPGAIFANVVIGDEINRASPKTQSALLEVMEEHTVSNDSITHPVPRPFIVVATQNPIDMEGTYRLPEAQLDRFLMRLSLGYPSHEAEVMVLRTQKDRAAVEHLDPVMVQEELLDLIEQAKSVEVAPALEDYIVALAHHTRTVPEVRLGVSPRGSLALLRCARVSAAAAGRSYATPEDIKALAPAVLTHRVVVSAEAELHGTSSHDVIMRTLATVPVPRAVTGA